MFAIHVFRESFHDDGEERIEGVKGPIVILGDLLLLKVLVGMSMRRIELERSL